MLKNIKIGTKIMINILIVSIALTSVNLIALINLNKASQESRMAYEQETQPIVKLSKIDELYLQSTVSLRDIVLKGFSEDRKSEADKLNKLDESIDQMTADLETSLDAEEKTMVAALRESLEKYRSVRQDAVDLAVNGTSITAKYAYQYIQSKTTQDAAAAVQDAINALQTELENDARTYYENNISMANLTQTVTVILIAASFLGAIMLGFMISRNFGRRVKKLEAVANKLASGDMDLTLDADSKDEIGILVKAVRGVVGAVGELVTDVNMLTAAAEEGRLDRRADTGKHTGEFKNIIQGVNNTLDIISDKIFWYENILDSMPLMVAVTDPDMRFQFINKKAEETLGIDRSDYIGKKCESWNTNICNTEDCAIARLHSGELKTHFEHNGFNFKANSAFISDRCGARVGQIEAIEDVTAEVKSAAYSQNEVAKLADNLRYLSEGRLNLEFEVDPGDEYTCAQKQNFEEINKSFQRAVESIAGYLREISYVLQNISSGDLTKKIESEFKGGFAEMKDSINIIIDSLNTLISDISLAAGQVAYGSSMVSGGNQAISQGAAQQAGSLEEISASVTGISQQIKENAEKTNFSRETGLSSSHLAESCNGMMEEMLISMKEINFSSENVTKIIKVIDDIAFQTNILALNAAVEAARAGVYGKGFAVVAEEVRNLAEKSAGAAKETNELIKGSLKKIDKGMKIAGETADALKKIVEGSKNAVRLEEEIAVTSNEQAEKIKQVNKGIEQLSHVIQNNSATAQEGAAASQELAGQADLLKEKIGYFRLQDQNTKDPEINENLMQ